MTPVTREPGWAISRALVPRPPRQPAPRRSAPRLRQLVLVGGVPGAGKTTLLRTMAPLRPSGPGRAVLLDPDRQRRWLAHRLPASVGYRWYRPIVHAVHLLVTLTLVLAGPDLVRGDVVVAEPATRPGRREWLARLARTRGWDCTLILLDVPREVALAGQRSRGRVLGSASFARHWERWTEQRPGLARAGRRGAAVHSWSHVHVVGRDQAPHVLLRTLAPEVEARPATATSL